MGGGCGLGAAALEIDDANDLKVFPWATMWEVPERFRGLLFREDLTDLVHLLEGIDPVVVVQSRRNWPFAFIGHDSQSRFRNRSQFRHLLRHQSAKRLF